MAFSFDLFKYVATDPTTASLAGATSILDYYGKKGVYKKKKAYDKFQANVLEAQKVAQENGIEFNTYLTNSVIKQKARQSEARQKEISAQLIAKGAAIGQQGSAAALVARDAEFKRAQIVDGVKTDIERNISEGQVKLDNITLQYDTRIADLDYKASNLEGPSIFSSIVDTADVLYSDFKNYEKARRIEEAEVTRGIKIK